MPEKHRNRAMSEGIRKGMAIRAQKELTRLLQQKLDAPGQAATRQAMSDQRVGEWNLDPHQGPATPDMSSAPDVSAPDVSPVNFGAEGGGGLSELMRFSLGGSKTFTKQEVRQGYRRLR
jgi:hypothetical protein